MTAAESKEIKNVVNNVKDQEKILELLRNNEVTPIGVEDVLEFYQIILGGL